MPADSTGKIDMRTFVDSIRGERFRGFILHGTPLTGKSIFARKLTELIGGVYIDVLDVVARSPELTAQVDTLEPNFLKMLALDAANAGASLVLLDEFDFLVPVWGGDVGPIVEIARKLS